MIKIITSLFLSLFATSLYAEDLQTAEEILAMAHINNPTNCATEKFANAIYQHINEIDAMAPEAEVRAWAKTIMFSKEVLESVLKCPEITSVADTETIFFTPIIFTFGNDRTITINYATQPKVLKQKLLLTTKRSLPNSNPNPKLMDDKDPAIYINTDPAWYAIMVVEHGALSQFVGADKNNTLSMQYINENIDNIYPKGFSCTSKSALANDTDTINRVVHEIADIEDDPNDYYVAGDVNLEWIMYAEIAADVIITVATFGGGAFLTGALKGARATKTGVRLAKTARNLRKFEHVEKYAQAAKRVADTTEKISKMEKNLSNARKYERAMKNLDNARASGKNVAKYEKEAQEIFEQAKKIDPDITEDLLKSPEKMQDTLKTLREQEKTYGEAVEEMLKDNKKELAQKEKELAQMEKDMAKGTTKATVEITPAQAKQLEELETQIAKLESKTNRTPKEAEKLKKLHQEYNELTNKIGTKNADELAKAKKAAFDKKAIEDARLEYETAIQRRDYVRKYMAEHNGALPKNMTKREFQQINEAAEQAEKTLKNLELSDYDKLKQEVEGLKSVDKYIDASKELENVLKYHRELRAFKRPQTGNIVVKNFKRIKALRQSAKAAKDGAQMLSKAGRVARSGMSSRSAKITDWLFDATLKHGARLARLESKLGAMYGAVVVVEFLGDMYDKTSSTSTEFSNGIEFKPLGLLSADDLEGQDNVVNYGMWLLWEGNSTDPADDDAAYLQALDFAEKFDYVLHEYQEEHGAKCNIDIYVVRPIIRIDESDPNDTKGEMFYLFMNDKPWTTADQF